MHGFLDRPSVWDKFLPLLGDLYHPVAPEFSWSSSSSAPATSVEPLSAKLGEEFPGLIIAHSRGAYEVVREIVDQKRNDVALLVLVGWSNQARDRTAEIMPNSSALLLEMCRSFISDRMRVDGMVFSATKRDWLARYAMQRFESWDRNVWVDPISLTSVEIPTLLVFGENDKTMTLEEVRRLADVLPDAEVAVIRDSAHWPMLEQPQALADAVLDFATRRECR